MKKLGILLLCMIMAFMVSGCAGEEIARILEARDAAKTEYTSFDYESTAHWFVETEPFTGEYDTYIIRFEQEDNDVFKQLRNGDRIAHGTVLNNKGTSDELFGEYNYYQKGDYAYYDVKGKGKYKIKSLAAATNDEFSDYIESLDASAFESATVTKLTNGGKKLRLTLDPSSVPEEIASNYLTDRLNNFLPPSLEAASASLVSFEYTLVLDENFLDKKEIWEMAIRYDLKSGGTAYATHETTMNTTKYYNIEGDHLVFPVDLDDYQDYETYSANLYK